MTTANNTPGSDFVGSFGRICRGESVNFDQIWMQISSIYRWNGTPTSGWCPRTSKLGNPKHLAATIAGNRLPYNLFSPLDPKNHPRQTSYLLHPTKENWRVWGRTTLSTLTTLKGRPHGVPRVDPQNPIENFPKPARWEDKVGVRNVDRGDFVL